MTYLPYRPDRAPSTSPVATPRLTAAAPDLLAALEAAMPTLLEECERAADDGGDDRVAVENYEAARTAIAKATGESQ
mgnify:CR=1 FL=1|jgi:hypothetical protein